MNLRNNEPSEKWTFGKADCNQTNVTSNSTLILLTHMGNLAKASVQQYPIPHVLWFWTLLPQTLDVFVKWIGVPMWIWTLLLRC